MKSLEEKVKSLEELSTTLRQRLGALPPVTARRLHLLRETLRDLTPLDAVQIKVFGSDICVAQTDFSFWHCPIDSSRPR